MADAQRPLRVAEVFAHPACEISLETASPIVYYFSHLRTGRSSRTERTH